MRTFSLFQLCDRVGYTSETSPTESRDAPAAANAHSIVAVLMVRTPQSAAVICQSGPTAFYYRGLRLSDGATIELAGAIPDGAGFSVTNPVDGTK
jgi:hypothetical protein